VDVSIENTLIRQMSGLQIYRLWQWVGNQTVRTLHFHQSMAEVPELAQLRCCLDGHGHEGGYDHGCYGHEDHGCGYENGHGHGHVRALVQARCLIGGLERFR